MAERYDLRSQQDVDRSSYVALPGTTTGGEFVTHNITPMKSKLSPAREVPGCNPGRWIYELVNNCFTVCDIFDRARHAKLETPFPWQHTHQLVVNGNQTHTPIISAVCLDCHFHFVFKTAWEASHAEELCQHQQARWPLQDSQFPWHHLVWAGSETDSTIFKESTKYYPLLAREFFVCSAPPCTFEVTLEVSAPRMPSSWINLLEDHDSIREHLRIAKEQEPGRYESAPDQWVYQAPSNLNTYLKNLIEAQSPDDARNISKRNKRFAVLFGPRCYKIFRELEFEEQVVERDGIDEGVFIPKLPPPPSGPSLTSALGTYRAYLEDVRSEVQCLIHKKSHSEEKPTFCLPLLAAELHCETTPKLDTNPFAKLDRYKLLGVLPDQRKEMMVNAYKRQWELLPSKRKELIEALMAIANDNNDQELSEYAMTQGSVFESQIQQQSSNDDDDGLVSQALTFLGLRPPNNYTAESLIQVYRQKLAKNPGDANAARSMLSLIAQASTDDTYQATLLMETDAKMSFNTAKVILGLVDAFGFGPDTLESTKAKIDASKQKEEKATYLDAMEAIADHVNSNDLRSTVAEMRQNLGIITPGSNNSTTNQDRPVNYDLPVGLENIGNTCYLNSLLQYLYTVKPVRDVVLNYESFKLDLTDENIEERRIGSNKVQMERGEAVVAQAFAQELSKLFRALETSDRIATRPSQRLANAALLSTRTLLNDDSKQKSETSATPKPPPLPARPSPAPPTNSSEDVEMISVPANPVSDLCETASTQSSQTLVDQNDDNDSERSYEKVENLPLEADTQESDITMGDHNDTPNEETQRITHETSEASKAKPDDDKDSVETSIDVKMPDAEQSKTIDEKVLTALEHQKRSSGTDQEDVEEVLGSILNLLQAAIKPSSIDKSTGIQFEKIMETFFVTTVNYTKKFDGKTYNPEIVSDRSITAFPAPEGDCSLHDALGRDFDQHTIEEDKLSRYTAIRTLPPVLHVLIQRSQALTSKNKNPIVIPEILYLDRYMDHAHDSPEFQKRVESWTISDRITDLKKHQTVLVDKPLSAPYLQKYAEENESIANPDVDIISQFMPPDETWGFDGPVEDDFLLVNPPTSDATTTPELPPKPEGIVTLEETVREMITKELRHREMSLLKNYEGESIPYRLHAVLCHRGQVMSGHYWVWIHDAEENVWRKYNDSNVEENRNTAEVLHTLSTTGEPYFLCYVREGDKDDFVDVPKRQRPEATDVDADGDVSVSTQGSETAPQPAGGELPAYSETPGA